jgi:hypothetical protein
VIQTIAQAPRTRLAVLTAVALAGTLDVATFALVEPSVAFKTAGRAGGTVFALAVWVALTGTAGRRWSRPQSTRLRLATTALAALAAVDGVGLAAVHIAVGAGGIRPVVGAALGLGSLALAVSAWSHR